MRFGILVFPGTWSDSDCHHALGAVLGYEVEYIWHQATDLAGFDCIVIPGGFSYGDHLRAGAIARFAPVMRAVEQYAAKGGLVIGICNGFQVLCEAGLLPGALIVNDSVEFRCQWTNLRVENAETPFTRLLQPGQVIRVPISHGEGNYVADAATLDRLEANHQVVVRYVDEHGAPTPESNPNGSLRNIAGICNEQRNVFGLMPHPERCCEAILGGTDGALIFRSIAESVAASRLVGAGR